MKQGEKINKDQDLLLCRIVKISSESIRFTLEKEAFALNILGDSQQSIGHFSIIMVKVVRKEK